MAGRRFGNGGWRGSRVLCDRYQLHVPPIRVACDKLDLELGRRTYLSSQKSHQTREKDHLE